MNYIYIVRTIDLTEKTQSDLEREFEVMKINHPLWKTKTYEEFIDFMKGWKWDKYKQDYENNAYFETYEQAYEKVINNVCDINDGGIYDYVSIIKMPMNCCYTESYLEENDTTLFKFNYKEDTYFEINKDFDEKTKWLSGLE